MDDAPGPQDLSQFPVVCPVCHQVHERCEFRAGSVYCAWPDCRNPHHRERQSAWCDPAHEPGKPQ